MCEALPARVVQEAERAARLADALLVVSTSGVVYSAAGLVDVTAAHLGLVNAEPWDQSQAAISALDWPSRRDFACSSPNYPYLVRLGAVDVR